MQQACYKCSRLVLNAAVAFEMLQTWYALNAAVALMGFRKFFVNSSEYRLADDCIFHLTVLSCTHLTLLTANFHHKCCFKVAR